MKPNSIAGNFGDDPTTIEAARLKLANIILSFPHDKIRDAEQIKNSSLLIMALQYRMQPASLIEEGPRRLSAYSGIHLKRTDMVT